MADENSPPAPSDTLDVQEKEGQECDTGDEPSGDANTGDVACSDVKEDPGPVGQQPGPVGQQRQGKRWSQLMGIVGTAKHWASKGAETVSHGVVTVGGLTRGGVDAAGGLISRVTSNQRLSEEAIALEKSKERGRERHIRVQVRFFFFAV